MNGAGAHLGQSEAGHFGRRSQSMGDTTPRHVSAGEQRGLVRIDVNWVACYHESAALGFKRARASTRFP